MTTAPLHGLLLTGGRSTRMGRDKAALSYGGRTQADAAFDLLTLVCARAFVSARREQADEPGRAGHPQIHDVEENLGPAGGIWSAFRAHPDAAWLVLACDLPFANEALLRDLVARRQPGQLATAYRSAHDGLPEPLCAIYEPAFLPKLDEFLAAGLKCPRKMLIRLEVPLLDLPDPRALDNVNEPAEFEAALRVVAQRQVRVAYFAILREAAGRDGETLATRAATPAALYGELAARYHFPLPADRVRAAVNGAYVPADHLLHDGDEVLFIPPVAGG